MKISSDIASCGRIILGVHSFEESKKGERIIKVDKLFKVKMVNLGRLFSVYSCKRGFDISFMISMMTPYRTII